MNIDQTPTPDPASSRHLFNAGLGALLALVAWVTWRYSGDLPLAILIGLLVTVLGCYPALLWAKNRSLWFPAFEISMLTCVGFYAVPLLRGQEEVTVFSPGVQAEAAFLVLLYLLAANLGFALPKNRPRVPLWASNSLLTESAHRYIPIGMVLYTVYLYITGFTTIIPYNIEGSLRALFVGLGTICIFVLSGQLGHGKLSQRETFLFLLNMVLQIVFMVTQLYLIGTISAIGLAIVAYASAKRRVPWLVIAVTLPVLALLHQGKFEMRERYWKQGQARPTLTELPAYFQEWIGYSLAADNEDDSRPSSIFERASLIQMLCLSVDRVPSIKPYMDGESYVDIPALFIPRFIWPEKPSSLLANVRLALYFNLVTLENSLSVSIAFGMLAEAYVNFGHIGVVLLGFLFGIGLKRISLLAQGCPQFSALGIFMILLTTWGFQTELVLATWVSSLFQAVVVCIGLPLIYHRFTHA